MRILSWLGKTIQHLWRLWCFSTGNPFTDFSEDEIDHFTKLGVNPSYVARNSANNAVSALGGTGPDKLETALENYGMKKYATDVFGPSWIPRGSGKFEDYEKPRPTHPPPGMLNPMSDNQVPIPPPKHYTHSDYKAMKERVMKMNKEKTMDIAENMDALKTLLGEKTRLERENSFPVSRMHFELFYTFLRCYV